MELLNGFGKVYLTIDYNAAGPWLHINWVGYQTFTSIVAGANACLDLLREQGCACLLNDNRQLIGPWNHAVEWLVSDWGPRAAAQGLTHFATILHPESLGASASNALFTGLGKSLQMRLFGTIEEAQAWLRTAPRQAA